jgi:nucleoid-associated protein YgaU
MFVESGVPVRAKLQVTFNEYKSPLDEAKEIKRRTADFTRRYIVGEAETLSSIAAAVYKDPAKWRPIAIANNVDDPRRLRAGTRLTVPSLPYRDPSSGEVFA